MNRAVSKTAIASVRCTTIINPYEPLGDPHRDHGEGRDTHAFTLAEDVGDGGRVTSFFDGVWWSTATITDAEDPVPALIPLGSDVLDRRAGHGVG